MRKVMTMLFLSFVTIGSHAQDSLAIRYAETITAAELKDHLMILASDEFEGRETGKEGQKKAAAYIADYFKSLGVKPVVNGSYFQEFPLRSERTSDANIMINGERLNYMDDMFFFPGFDERLIESEVMFMGYGIDDEVYSDYANAEVEGKIVIVASGEPVKKGISLITGTEEMSEWSGDWRMKRDAAMKHGAIAMITVREDYQRYLGRIRYWLENPGMRLDMNREEKEEVLPTFFISTDALDRVMTAGKVKSASKLISKMNKRGQSITMPLEGKMAISIDRELSKFTSENVLCYIPGSDAELKDELVVVTAHYDHVGMNGDDIYNGADDDGSGTVTVLEIAEAFVSAAAEGHGPRRSVLVMTVSGEEKGLLGSEWYSLHPIFPLKTTIVDLNVDMIGRVDEAHIDNENYIYLIGSDKLSTELHEISETANSTYTGLELDYTYNDPNDPNRFYFRSDHYNFAKNNIPVIFYFSGVHEDYHQPTDTPDKIMYEKTARIGKLIFYTAWQLANQDQRIEVDVINAFE